MNTHEPGASVNERDLVGLVSEVAHGRISRRRFIERGLALGLSGSAVGGFLAACGNKDDGGPTAGPGGEVSYPSPGTMPDTLFLYNWSDYMAPKVLKDFEAKYGVKVKETYYDSNEELLAKLKAGATGYDVIVPSDYMVSIMIKTGILMPLDMRMIPNIKNAEQFLQKPKFDPETDGKKFSVPYMFGTTGIGVRTDKYSGEVTSWQVMFDPANSKKIVMLNDERETPGAALKLLGYSLNTTDEAQLEQAVQKLIEQKPLLQKYDSVPNRVLASGVPLTHCWDGDVIMAAGNIGMDKLKYVLPDEGYVIWADGLAIPQGTPSPYVANLFLNYLLDTNVAAECANYIGYQSGVATATPLIKSKDQSALRPTAEQMAKAEFIEDLGEFNRNYSDAWAKVKSG